MSNWVGHHLSRWRCFVRGNFSLLLSGSSRSISYEIVRGHRQVSCKFCNKFSVNFLTRMIIFSDTRLARRVPRDIKERGRDLDQVLKSYMLFVKPAFEEFCSPTKKYADVSAFISFIFIFVTWTHGSYFVSYIPPLRFLPSLFFLISRFNNSVPGNHPERRG